METMIHPVPLAPGISPGESSRNCRGRWFRSIPLWILFPSALAPVVWWYIKRLDDGSDEPLGLLALGLACGLAWRDRGSLQTSARARIAGALVILVSVLTIGTLPPMLRAALAVVGTGSWFGLHRKPGLLGLLVLSLPVVASMQFYAGYPMRLAAAEGAVKLLELGGIVVARSGVNLELGGMTIGVDPACSGIRMLWHALAAAMALAAVHRVSWQTTIAVGLAAVLSAIPANILRAAWLALEESARIDASGLGHGGIGLVCFGVILIPLWVFVSMRALPAVAAGQPVPPGRAERMILLAPAMLAPLFLIRGHDPEVPVHPLAAPADFTFNRLTLPLHPLPCSAAESAFSKSFPGSLSSHRWGDDQVILRRTRQATRKLHSSHDCLRAAGFSTSDSVSVRCADGSEWSRFAAEKGGFHLTIHERIISEQDGSTWTDVSSWYWSAVWHPLNGPWRAETVISR